MVFLTQLLKSVSFGNISFFILPALVSNTIGLFPRQVGGGGLKQAYKTIQLKKKKKKIKPRGSLLFPVFKVCFQSF